MANEHFCLRCCSKSTKHKDNPFLCWECCILSDDWGSLIMNAGKRVLNYIEKYQTEAVKNGTAKRLTIDEFKKLFERAKNETKTLQTENANEQTMGS